MAVINNVAYSWSMIMLNFNSASDLGGSSDILLDCTAIKWSTTRKMENVYGLGGQARKRGFGNVTYEASITLPYGAQMQLREVSSDHTLIGLGEFDLQVSWINDLSQTAPTEVVTLAGCIFTEGGFDANQDDTSLTHEFDLHPFRIYTNDTASIANDSGWTRELYNG